MRIVSNTNETPDPDYGKGFWQKPDNWQPPEDQGNMLTDMANMVTSVVGKGTSLGEVCMSVLKSGIGSLFTGGAQEVLPFTGAPTVLDKQPTAGRSMAFAKLPFERVKILSKTAGATLNDLLLTACDIALQRYLEGRGDEHEARLVALLPMSLRQPGDTTTANCIAVSPATLILVM